MALVTTEAVVLHAFDYLESSRIYRLLTRDLGVQSVLAKGARRARGKIGSAVDLFAQGPIQLYLKPGRDLQLLAAFDPTRSRTALADVPGRFTGATALAELVLRFVREDAAEGSSLYDTFIMAIDGIAGATRETVREAALAGAWALVAELGFAPVVESCSACHASLPPEVAAAFSYPAGGVVCGNCERSVTVSRMLPPRARAALGQWIAGRRTACVEDGDARAHQRLLREFVAEHLTEGRELKAFAVWEHGGWDA